MRIFLAVILGLSLTIGLWADGITPLRPIQQVLNKQVTVNTTGKFVTSNVVGYWSIQPNVKCYVNLAGVTANHSDWIMPAELVFNTERYELGTASLWILSDSGIATVNIQIRNYKTN